jgi:type I restriction enzyme R subunit
MSSESEWATRKKRMDPMLAAAGWLVRAFEPGKRLAGFTRHALTEFPTDNGPADYALFVAGHPFGVVEAKKLTLGPQNVLSQAQRYEALAA